MSDSIVKKKRKDDKNVIEGFLQELSQGDKERRKLLESLRSDTLSAGVYYERLNYLSASGCKGVKLDELWKNNGGTTRDCAKLVEHIDKKIALLEDDMKREEGLMLESCARGNATVEAMLKEINRYYFDTIPTQYAQKSTYLTNKVNAFLIKLVRMGLVGKKLVEFFESEDEKFGCNQNVIKMVNKVDKNFRQHFEGEQTEQILSGYARSLANKSGVQQHELKLKVFDGITLAKDEENYNALGDIVSNCSLYLCTNLGETSWIVLLNKIRLCGLEGSALEAVYLGEEVRQDVPKMINWIDRRYHEITKEKRYHNFAVALSTVTCDLKADHHSLNGLYATRKKIKKLLVDNVFKYEPHKTHSHWFRHLINALAVFATDDSYMVFYVLFQAHNMIERLFDRTRFPYLVCNKYCGELFRALFSKGEGVGRGGDKKKQQQQRDKEEEEEEEGENEVSEVGVCELHQRYTRLNKEQPELINAKNVRMACVLYCLFTTVEELSTIVVYIQYITQIRTT